MSLRSNEQILYPGCDIFLARVIKNEDGTETIGPQRDCGSVQQIPNVQFNTQRNEIRSPRRGNLTILDSRVVETGESYPLVLYNFAMANLAMAFGGRLIELNQTAGSVGPVPHNVYPDSYLPLRNANGDRVFQVSATGLTIGSLVEDVDYVLTEEDLMQGRVKILPGAGITPVPPAEYEQMDVTFELAAMSGERLILPRTDVIQEFEAEIVYPEYGAEAGLMRTGLRVSVEPGSTNWNQREGSTLAVTLTVLSNNDLDEPYGRLVQYKGGLAPRSV